MPYSQNHVFDIYVTVTLWILCCTLPFFAQFHGCIVTAISPNFYSNKARQVHQRPWQRFPIKVFLNFFFSGPSRENFCPFSAKNRLFEVDNGLRDDGLEYEQCVDNHPTWYFAAHHTIGDAASIVFGWIGLIEPQSCDLEFKTYKLRFREEGGNVNSGSLQRTKNHSQHNKSRTGCSTIWNRWLLIFIFVTTS